jgi:hypothetical protein
MKKIVILIVSVFLITSTQLDAKKKKISEKYSNAISLDPIGLFLDFAKLTYEMKVLSYSSANYELLYRNRDNWLSIGFGGSYKWYPISLKPLEGFFIGTTGYLSIWKYNEDSSDNTEDRPGSGDYDGGAAIVVGAILGYKLIFKETVFIEPTLKYQYPISEINETELIPYVTIGINVGYAW